MSHHYNCGYSCSQVHSNIVLPRQFYLSSLEPYPYKRSRSHSGGGGGGVLIIFLGGGVPPGPENPYPISDRNIRFSIPYFRPDSQNVYPISDPVRCGNFSNSQWIYGVRDFVTPQTMFVSFSSRCNARGNTLLLKMVLQTKKTAYTPYFRPRWQNLYPISD